MERTAKEKENAEAKEWPVGKNARQERMAESNVYTEIGG
jgi:hypothetical protein